jgi:hypothetical protein
VLSHVSLSSPPYPSPPSTSPTLWGSNPEIP